MEKTKKTTSKTPAKKTAAKKTPSAGKLAAPKKTAAKKATAPKKAAATPKMPKAKKPAARTSAKKIDPTLEILKKCWTALDDKKAEDIKILDVRGKSPITNYFIIATATSDPHMRALASELDKTLKDLGVKEIRREYNDGSGWIVVDGFDFMAHIFLPEQRGLYGIESLWKDADTISPDSL